MDHRIKIICTIISTLDSRVLIALYCLYTHMKDRKSALLSAIISEHVSTGNAISSKLIVDNHDFSVSPATIRNEMASLEKEGYIYQPHTSAGRIPTEKGWKEYIEHYLNEIELPDKQKREIDDAFKENGLTVDMAIKRVAKHLAEFSQQAVFVGFSKDDFYYTGMSNLFEHPEFESIDLVRHVTGVVDHMDDVITKIFDDVTDDIKIMLGSENPFGAECSSIITSYRIQDKEHGVFGILGPMRMNYENNLALIKHAQQLFSGI